LSELESLDAKIFHSKHPESLGLTLHHDIHPFSGNWDDIDIVVTDYSSIGDDFINSGGEKLIYFVPDRAEFEENQGSGLFFEDSLRRGAVCSNNDELVSKLHEYFDDSQQAMISKLLYPDYFKDLIETCKKRQK